jgi:hypothetical protein
LAEEWASLEQVTGHRQQALAKVLDTNGDDRVDLTDLNNVRNDFSASGFDVIGEANGNLIVDPVDLNHVRNNFGANRPDRFEPRVIKKRRSHHYGWLTRPRAEFKRDMAKGLIKI